MQAHELAVPYPVIGLDTDALTAARLLAERRLPGLIVVDEHRHPVAVLPGSQILRFALPAYVQDDPALARVFDERHADRLCAELADRRVKELLPTSRAPNLPVVEGDARVMEIAARMAEAHSPVVAVVEPVRGRQARLLGAITVADLLSRLLPGEPEQP